MTDGHTYTVSNGYDLAGHSTSQTYPSGRVIATTYDGSGRINGVTGLLQQTTKTYADTFSYTAHGAVAAMKFGTDSSNPRWEHSSFNSRLQPTLIGIGTNGTTDSSVLKLDYTYNTTGQANNNGNVRAQTITIGSTVMSQNYSYDALNRLSSATETGAWTQTYDCDRYGNRAVRNNSYIPSPTLTPRSMNSTDFSAFNQNTNRIALTGFGYDSAGNLTSDPTTGTNGMVYDAENRQTSYTKAGVTTTYTYDGDGHRVRKVVGSITTIFVYNALGQLIAEYTSDPVPPPPGGGGTSYLTTDHLGSTRVVMKQDGSVKARYDYLPFGEELGAGIGQRTTGMGYSGADSTKQKFTQKERDTESGLDYFLARYYSSAQGRFTSPDKPFAGQHEDDPQSWNLFAYARNNPLLYVDPSGEDYNIFDKDGNLIGQAKDQKDLKGYVLVSSENGGRLLKFEGGYRGEYFEGDPGKPVQAKDDSGMTPLARGVFLELDRRAAASIKLIDIAANITLTPISIISGTGLFRGGAGLTTLGLKGAAEAANAIEGGRLVAQAASTVGNQTVRASSRTVAEQAARDWVGEGAENIFNRQTGQIVGKISADGTRVARFTSASKAEPYINLVDKVTGGNLHIRF